MALKAISSKRSCIRQAYRFLCVQLSGLEMVNDCLESGTG